MEYQYEWQLCQFYLTIIKMNREHIVNYKKLKYEIDSIQTKENRNIKILVVSKNQSIDKIIDLSRLGHIDFAENYVDEAIKKIEMINNDHLCWHFIGKIQSNKIKKICINFDWIHTISDLNHAIKLDKFCKDLKKIMNVCIQINIDEEDNKNGIMIKEFDRFYNEISRFKYLKLRGIMSIPSQYDKNCSSFREMGQLYNQYNKLDVLSMGMSGDYLAAIENNANMIRIGQYIFGKRT